VAEYIHTIYTEGCPYLGGEVRGGEGREGRIMEDKTREGEV
jgi:hypothetical protein